MYEGGVQHGQGVIHYSNGHLYRGEFNNSKLEGEGVLTYNGKDMPYFDVIVCDSFL